MSNTRKATRRDRFLGRKLPSVPYYLAVEDDTEAREELAAAKEALEVAQLRDDDRADQAATDAQARLEKARKAVEACYESITLTAMVPAEFEALVAKPEHLPRDGHDERWNADTFPPAAFLASVSTDDLTADEWAEFTSSHLSQGERTHLFMTAVGLNARWPDGAIPKD